MAESKCVSDDLAQEDFLCDKCAKYGLGYGVVRDKAGEIVSYYCLNPNCNAKFSDLRDFTLFVPGKLKLSEKRVNGSSVHE